MHILKVSLKYVLQNFVWINGLHERNDVIILLLLYGYFFIRYILI